MSKEHHHTTGSYRLKLIRNVGGLTVAGAGLITASNAAIQPDTFQPPPAFQANTHRNPYTDKAANRVKKPIRDYQAHKNISLDHTLILPLPKANKLPSNRVFYLTNKRNQPFDARLNTDITHGILTSNINSNRFREIVRSPDKIFEFISYLNNQKLKELSNLKVNGNTDSHNTGITDLAREIESASESITTKQRVMIKNVVNDLTNLSELYIDGSMSTARYIQLANETFSLLPQDEKGNANTSALLLTILATSSGIALARKRKLRKVLPIILSADLLLSACSGVPNPTEAVPQPTSTPFLLELTDQVGVSDAELKAALPYGMGVLIPVLPDADTRTVLQSYLMNTQISHTITRFNTSRDFESWLYSHDIKGVQRSIYDFLIGNDKPQNWTNLQKTQGADDLLAVVQDLEAGRLVDGRYVLQQIGIDHWQEPRSEILRNVFVIKDTTSGQQYMIKIEPKISALQEATALMEIEQQVALEGIPNIKVPKTAVFISDRATKAVISVQEFLEGETVAQKIATYGDIDVMTSQNPGLTTLIQDAYKQLYAMTFRRYINNGQTSIWWDIHNPENVLITRDGQIAVIDAAVDPTRSGIYPIMKNGSEFIATSEGKFGLSGKALKVAQAFRTYLVKKLNVVPPDIEFSGQPTAQLTEPGQQAVITVVGEAGLETSATITNNSGSTLLIPNKIPVDYWNKLNSGLNVGLTSLAILALDIEINKQLGFDDTLRANLDIPINNTRFDISPEDYYDLFSDKVPPPDRRLFNYWPIPIEQMTTPAFLHEWIVNVREDNGFLTGPEELGLSLTAITSDPIQETVINNVSFANIDGQIRLTYRSFINNMIKSVMLNDSEAIIFDRDQAMQLDKDMSQSLEYSSSLSDVSNLFNKHIANGDLVFAVEIPVNENGKEYRRIIYGLLVQEHDQIVLRMYYAQKRDQSESNAVPGQLLDLWHLNQQ